MNFYKAKKIDLTWTDMPQLKFADWPYPILINTNNEVLLGNCLKDRLKEDLIVIKININKDTLSSLITLETLIATEHNYGRYKEIRDLFTKFFRKIKYKEETLSLFEIRDYDLITEENYRVPSAMKYGYGKGQDSDYEQMKLIEFEDELVEMVKKGKELPVEIDMSILEELL